MKGDKLPSQDHVARYCGYTTLSEDGKVSSTAFRLRKDRKEQYLSVQWLECLRKPDRFSEIQELRRILSGNLTLGTTARIAVLHVGTVCDYVKECSGYNIKVLHEPQPGDPSHSGIHDTIQDEIMIAELIVEKIVETYPAVLSH